MMNKRTSKRRRFFARTASVLCAAVVIGLVGLHQFDRLASEIYEPDVPLAVPKAHAQEKLKHGSFYDELKKQAAAERVEPVPLPEPEPTHVEPKGGLLSLLGGGTKKNETKMILLLGVDSRKGEQARADTIMLAAVPTLGGDIHLLSIPRDTWVPVDGHGRTKINHAMSYGGKPLIKKTVEKFLGVPIDHTVTVDFDGFRQVVDELGGLDVTVEKAMDYDDPSDGTSIHLRKGQTLQNGKEALDYARFRHDPEADTGRMRRQQRVIRAIIQKGSQPSNWTRIFRVAGIMGDHVKTDLPPGEWMHLVMNYAHTAPDQIKTLSLAGSNKISSQDRLWYFFADEAEKDKLSRQLQELRRRNGT